MEEMKNCENFCIKNNIQLFTKTLDEKIKHTELIAREERQKFFEECSKTLKNPVIFTDEELSL